MTLTIFSLSISIIWVSIFVQLIYYLRKRMVFINYFSVIPLLLMLFFCLLRMCLPLELPYTFVINSDQWLPKIQVAVEKTLFHINTIEIDLFALLTIIWFFVATGKIIKYIFTYYHFKHLLTFLPTVSADGHFKNICPKPEDIDLANIDIVIHEMIPSPAIFGFRKPIILLPRLNLSEDELLYILMHEWYHYQYGHIYVKCFVEVVQILFWWNPLFRKLSSEIANSLELYSDQKVCLFLSKKEQKRYLETILKIANQANSQSSVATCYLVEKNNSSNLYQRFRMITDNKYCTQNKKDCVVIPIIITIFILSYSFVLQPFTAPPTIEQSSSDIAITPESAYIEAESGTYKLYVNDIFVSEISSAELENYRLQEIPIY